MAGWQNLPVELESLILSHLSSLQALHACSSVSKRLHKLVEPLLYMAVVLPVLSTFHRDVSNQDPNQEDDAQDDWARTIRRFVRTIVTSPRGAELGKLVQDLTIDLGLNWEPSNDPRAHYWYSSDLDRCRRVFTLEEIEPTLLDGKTGPQQVIARELAEIAKAVTTSVSEPGSSPNQSSAKGKIDNGLIVQGRYHGLALVLLYHLPSLKTLKIEANGDMETIALSALDFFDSGVPPGLASIRELELVCANEKGLGLKAEAVVPFFTLLNLRSLTVNSFLGIDRGTGFMDNHPSVHVGPNIFETFDDDEEGKIVFPSATTAEGDEYFLLEDTAYGVVLPSKCSFITHLKFTRSAVSATLLDRILMMPLRLESFEYHFGEWEDEDTTFMPKAIANGLMAQASSLRSLIIMVSDQNDPATAYARNVGVIKDLMEDPEELLLGSLAHMEVLEKLAVPLDMLIGGITPSDAYEDEGNEEAIEEAPFSGPTALGPPLLPRSLSQLELSLPWIPQILLPKACKAMRLPESLVGVEQTLPSLQRITIYYGMQVQHASHKDIKLHRLDSGASSIDLDIRWLECDEEGLGRAMKHVPGSRWDEAI